MKRLLLTLLLVTIFSLTSYAQVGQSAREWKGGSAPSGACTVGVPPVVYQGSNYYCNAGTWAAGSGGGGGGGGITGTLTSGRIPYATSSSAVSDSTNLQWDNAAATLRVNGLIKFPHASNSSGDSYIKGGSGSDAGYVLFGDATGWAYHFAKQTDAGATKFFSIEDNGRITATGTLRMGSSAIQVTDSAGKVLSAALNTVGVAQGGTGQTSYTNGQLLIGNTTGNTLTKATLTAGSGITITNGTGSITIAATGGGGSSDSTVTVCASGCDYATLGAAVTGVGATVKTVKITGAVTESGNVTVPATMTLWPVGDAMVTTGANTLTVNGAVYDTGNIQWLADTSTVAFGTGIRTVRASWFGSTQAGLQKALDSLLADTHVLIISKNYNISSPLLLKKSGVTIIGEKDSRNGDFAVSLQGNHWGDTFQIGTSLAATFTTSLVTGSGDEQALTLSDNTHRINLDGFGMATLRGLSAFTAELFFKGVSDASQTTGDRATIIGSGAYEGTTYKEAFSLWRVGNGGPNDKKLEASLTVGGTTYQLTGSVIPQNTTQHIALTYDGSTIRLFQGGTQTASQAATGTVSQAGVEDVYLGAASGATRQGYARLGAKGDYDSVRISNSARYTAGFTPSTSKLTSDSNALLVMNFDGTSTEKQSYIKGKTGASPDTTYVALPSGSGTWTTWVTLRNLYITNYKGMGLHTIDTPNLRVENLSVYGYCGWCQEGQSFLSVIDGVHSSTLAGSGYTRFGLGFFGQSPAGSRMTNLDVNGGRIAQYIYGSPGNYTDVFMSTQNDTEVGLFNQGAGFIFQADRFQMDDEVNATGGTTRIAKVYLSNQRRVNWHGGYITSAFGSTPAVILDSVTEAKFSSAKLVGNAAQTAYFETAGTTPTVVELDQMERGDTTPPLVSSALANAARIKEAYQTQVRKDYTGAVGTTTLDLSLGEVIRFTFGAGNETLALSNIPKNGEFTLVAIQDGTGSRTFTYPSTLKTADGSGTFATQPNTAANSRTTFKFLCDGTNCYNVTSSIASSGSGTVTSVAQSFTGGLISVGGSPITSSGTLALTVAGTSGGIPYFSSSSTWASSAALAANAIVVGGGAGAAPSTTTTGTGVLTALGVNTGSSGAFVVNGGALGTPSSGTLTNATGLPISTGVSGLGTGVATALAIAANGSGGFVTDTGTVTLTNKTISGASNTLSNIALTSLTSDTSTALGVGSLNIGHASDTTVSRVSAGVLAVEGVNVVTTSSTDTLTNKTIDAESTGNVITLVRDIEFVVAGANAGTGGPVLDIPSSNGAAAGVYTGSNQFFGVLDFDASTDESVQGHFRLPTGWTGNIDLNGEWMAAATSGTVRWAIQTACVADAELDPSWNTAQTWGDAAKGTTNQNNTFSQSALTTTGCAAGERFHFKFYRDADGTSGTDDMTGDARLKSLIFTIRVAH